MSPEAEVGWGAVTAVACGGWIEIEVNGQGAKGAVGPFEPRGPSGPLGQGAFGALGAHGAHFYATKASPNGWFIPNKLPRWTNCV